MGGTSGKGSLAQVRALGQRRPAHRRSGLFPAGPNPAPPRGRTVDFILDRPNLDGLAGFRPPRMWKAWSIKTLLQDPSAPRDQPAVTTYQFNNHAVRSEGWRYIRYANGDQELYDETADPNEWTNLATIPSMPEKSRGWPKPCRRRISPTSAAGTKARKEEGCRKAAKKAGGVE